MKNIHEGWKTTVLGIVLIVCGVGYIAGSLYYKSEIEAIVLSILFLSGGGLVLAPDTVIEAAKNIITKKSKNL
jgi:hypothetical protein